MNNPLVYICQASVYHKGAFLGPILFLIFTAAAIQLVANHSFLVKGFCFYR